VRAWHEFLMQSLLLFALLWVTIGTIVVAWMNRGALVAFWREPVLKYPVLIIESDDWGAGPPEQAEQLDRIAAVLRSHTDRLGQKPVMTLGIVLGVADGPRILADGLRHYYGKSLGHAEFASTLAAIRRGAETGVFALQLHGGEHYWPPALLRAARTDAQVAAWLVGSGAPTTESLPAALQSRWTDATELPSKPLHADEIRTAALTEVERFRDIFGKGPKVAVPPTFIWNNEVEAAWSEAGVQFVVTPGRRHQTRDADGEPAAAGPAIANGNRGAGGITYLVRDDYFEPARGHRTDRGLAALAGKTRTGRPTLLETHRANFLGDATVVNAAIKELDRLLALVLEAFPDVQFHSTEELALLMRRQDPQLMERRFSVHLHVWLQRLWEISRLRKLACLTGLIVPAWLLYISTWRRTSSPSR
jgi:hypothetical protein